MKSIKTILPFLLLIPLLLTGCVRELWPDADASEWVIPFSAPPSTEVVVSTKGTLTSKVESSINNIYVFIFDSSDKKIFGQLFDESNKGAATLPNYWTSTTDDTGATDGVIHLKTGKVSGCKIVAICNIDAEMIDLSPEYLGTIANYSQIQGLKVTLNQLTLSRNGNFPMVAESPSNSSETVDFNTETTPSYSGSLTFRRLDAKIKFTVRAEAGYNINNFTPTSWQVVNVPKVSYVLPHIVDYKDVDAASTAQDFFDSEATVFETEDLQSNATIKYVSGKRIPIHGFSFYMMENRKAPLAHEGSWTYADRERQNKSTGAFVFADPLATYVIIKGKLETKNGTTTTMAEVRYVIHLGDFGDHGDSEHAANADFDVKRNHTYTYNIYIRGAEHIKVEVQDDAHPENEPGATGDILISEGEAITCDSHYSTHAINFYYKDILPDRMNWWVQTPFNPDGADPESTNLSGIDYGWVEFRVNSNAEDKESGNYKSNWWTKYLPRKGSPADKAGKGDGKTMTLPELMAFLKHQKDLYDHPELYPGETHQFDNTPSADGGPKITVTAFVNEYYYETNPLTGQYEKDLWRKFVDQPMRTMCILSKVEASPDKESHVVSSSFTIQQHAIQSVYNINKSDLHSGWGSEYLNDVREAKCERDVKNNQYWSSESSSIRGNADPENGRWDTMIEWELRTSADDSYTGDNKTWSTYLNLTEDNDNKAYMNETYRYLRYSCMSRNRDNDGDGYIDKDEVRWYMAASNQLIGLFLGANGIESASRLYQRSPEDRASTTDKVWRQHVLASNCVSATSNSNTESRVVWAEEGMNGSYWGTSANRGYKHSVRCVRNFGYDPNGDSAHGKDITYSDETVKPESLITIERHKKGVSGVYSDAWSDDVYYDFDCSRFNDRALRFYTDKELVLHNEHSEAACLYKHFRMASINESITITEMTIEDLNTKIDTDPHFKYCPDGYRLPNVREAGIILYYLDSEAVEKYFDDKHNTFTRTYWSFGKIGEYKKTSEASFWGWGVGMRDGSYKGYKANTGTHKTKSIRCVKDIMKD